MPPPEAPRPFGIVDVLRLKIVSGEYPEGAKLPGETALAGQLQASRSTVRRALVELGREGLVSAARGRGTFVRVLPDKRAIVIGDEVEHEDLLEAAYEPVRRGWTPVWPSRLLAPVSGPGPGPASGPAPGPGTGPAPAQQQTRLSQQAYLPRRSGSTQVRGARIVGCNSVQAATLGLGPKQPIVLRDQRWRHQANGFVIALSSFAPTSLFGIFRERPKSEPFADGRNPDHGSRPESEDGVAVFEELKREHGPVTFSASVKARMPGVREREELEMETGVPLLVVTRTMFDPAGHPLEATVVHAPADRFEVAHVSRKPILSL
ncbi:GntR family transcriptional regulator [Actinospica robiniae]|uniref:GntR family transcriptional regulator n=1 Tax=Actinospica robiniae TaxID=304901 RepID=UPI0003F6D32A|nr:GntR family transcriptional regulator [Actinospica robiniae]